MDLYRESSVSYTFQKRQCIKREVCVCMDERTKQGREVGRAEGRKTQVGESLEKYGHNLCGSIRVTIFIAGPA